MNAAASGAVRASPPEGPPLRRLLVWDFPRGGLAYDLLWALLLLFLLGAPKAWFSDPLAVLP